jgi:Sec-independent protein translocase protein TatA
MSFGFWEVMLLLLIVLIVFGAGRLPRAPDDSRERENGSGSS